MHRAATEISPAPAAVPASAIVAEPLLELRGVSRSFLSGEREVTVLREINLTIHAGEIVAIMGASGSGKSTLMNLLGCLDHASAGSYRVRGRETGTLDGDELARLRREHFGFIFQRYHLLPNLSAAGNVEMPAIYAGVPPGARHARAQALLTRLGLSGREAHRPGQLSGGQQQRVSIARALMNGGEVILADEPTGALDSKSGQDVIRILRELNAQGHTVIIVTHDEKVAANARRIIEISDGEIVSDRANTPTEDVPVSTPEVDIPPHERRLTASLGRFAEAFRMAWMALLSHRLRTLLTMLGIIIGITSVVSIVAIGAGAKAYMLNEIGSIGTTTIDIYPGKDWGDTSAASIQTLVPADAQALRDLYYVDSVTPGVGRSLLLRRGNVDVSAQVSGVGESFFQVRGVKLAQGIAFGEEALRRQTQVAVIDANTQRKLFPHGEDPLGEVILVDNLPCTVIGVTSEKKSMFGSDKNLNIWLPYTTASSRLFGQTSLDSITVRVRDGQPTAAAEAGIVKLMEQRHGRKDFFTYNMDTIAKTMQRTSQSITLLLALIAVISLVVGGIGVMNIMLVSVTERTREIGIRMAVGARQSDVMQQFLVEAVLVCLIGGALGITLSFGFGVLFSLLVDEWKMVFSGYSIAMAFFCSTLIGIVFGFVPARNASRLDPVDALSRD
ncbi:macrolide ABC transporter ATP-binding protein/permease MacB [Paraburkholderia bonniea]|uniref:macrolide ABC transporter ATP-binding protein/permease MacB n=1 Tax=Paraburkholderia bonniea TaxID=2152891 RepID=UPI001291DA79|nr:macrolide ABC transporter ATP-binding protein/permease MacB [Paraburkholderia bonniea]WJF91877.1 macrolide ABC transporter ATP-binding protein/permease MacB [Paraburkholderia bonniea]WJF95196.1 macrolide ABC transporter ATP-binding protein/permease MacB [Paraburkholderia bonniea]